MPLELADDGLRGKGGEGHPVGRVEAVGRLDQPDHGRLHEVLAGSARTREPAGQVTSEADVVLHEAVWFKAGAQPGLPVPSGLGPPAHYACFPALGFQYAAGVGDSCLCPIRTVPGGALYASRLRFGREKVALSPEEIENRTFPAVVRGYERSAVDAFLHEVAAEVRRLQSAAARAVAQPAPVSAAQPEAAAAPVDPYETVGAQLATLLRTAGDSAARIRREAEDIAETTRREAEEEAERLLGSAEERAREVVASAEREADQLVAEANANLQRAQEEAQSIVEQARQEATEGLEHANARAERSIQEAEVTRLQAQEAANQARAQAERDAERIRQQAEGEADRLITEAQARNDQLRNANVELRERLAAVESVLRSVAPDMAGASEITGGAGA